MNLIDSVLQELTLLQQDQKRNQALKTMIVNAIEEIKSSRQLAIQSLIKILVRVPESKTAQTTGIALNIISKMISRLKEPDEFHHVLHIIYLLKDEVDQFKLVQCGTQLMNEQLITLKNPEGYEKLIHVFLLLAHSKNSIVQSSCMTALNGIVEMLSKEDNPKQWGILMNQLYSGMIGQKVSFLIQSAISKGICRDLLFQSKIPEDMIQQLSTIVYEDLQVDSTEIQFNVRRIRDAFKLLPTDMAIVKHISLLYQRAPQLYVKAFILDGIAIIFKQKQLLQQLSQVDHQESYLQHLQFLVKLGSEHRIDHHGQHVKLWDTCILCLSEEPIVGPLWLRALEAIQALNDSVQELAYDRGVRQCEKNEDAQMRSLLENSWMLNFKALIHCMKWSDATQYHAELLIIQNWISLLGSLTITKGRDHYIKFLTLECVHPLSLNSIQATKTLFNVAQLGAILDVKSWHLIIKAMQQFETLKSQEFAEDYQLLMSMMDLLFTSSNTYEDNHLMDIIDGLCQCNIALMEQCQNTQTIDTKFGLNRLLIVIKCNWHRYQIFWDYITTHFTCITASKFKQLRDATLDIFQQMIQHGFQHFFTLKQQNWQQILLKPLAELVQNQYHDVKETILILVFKLIQNNGLEFTKEGLEGIIDILTISCQDSEPGNYVNHAFHILELLISSFLNVLSPTVIRVLLPLIEQFRLRTSEQNVSYISVGLIWQLADNLSKSNLTKPELEQLWYTVLLQLQNLSLETAQDVRQAALHIIVQILLINCQSFETSFQEKVITEILFTILDQIISIIASSQDLLMLFSVKVPKYISFVPQWRKVQSAGDGWEDSLRLLIQSLSKILKKTNAAVFPDIVFRVLGAFKINNVDLKFDIVKLIRDNVSGNVWVPDFQVTIRDFICQKMDNKDSKTIVNRILPEICDLYTQIEIDFVNYQLMIDYPINLEQMHSIKIWMDDKQIYDFVQDYYAVIGNKDSKILQFLLHNISKEQAVCKLQDLVILKYSELFTEWVPQDSDLIVKFVDLMINKIRPQISLLNSVKVYSKTNRTLSGNLLPFLLKSIKMQDQLQQLGNLLGSLSWERITSMEGLRSMIDNELQICEFLLGTNEQAYIQQYWVCLSRNMGVFQFEDILFETRSRLLSIISKSSLMKPVSKELFTQFMRDEYMSGSMPLSRKRVSEIVQLLLALQEVPQILDLFEPLIELVTTREVEIKAPLQQLFRVIARDIQK